MGRPSLADVRRAQIRDAYEECVLQFGLQASTLQAIADQAAKDLSVSSGSEAPVPLLLLYALRLVGLEHCPAGPLLSWGPAGR